MESLSVQYVYQSVSDGVLNLCLEPININSLFVGFKVSLLDTSHLLSFSRS